MMSTANHTPWFPAPNLRPTSSNPTPADDKILIAAILSLIFVIFIVIALHLYGRRLLHRRITTTILSTRQTQPNLGGLEPSALAAIPAFVCRTRAAGQATAECAVCLSAVDDGEVARLLPGCKHVFHAECIDAWLCTHRTCPVCRARVETSVGPQSKPAEAKEGTSGGPGILGSSFRRMLSGSREWSGRSRAHGTVQPEHGGDLERQ